MNLEGIMLSGISQAEKDSYLTILHMCGSKNNKVIAAESRVLSVTNRGGAGDGETLQL